MEKTLEKFGEFVELFEKLDENDQHLIECKVDLYYCKNYNSDSYKEYSKIKSECAEHRDHYFDRDCIYCVNIEDLEELKDHFQRNNYCNKKWDYGESSEVSYILCNSCKFNKDILNSQQINI